MVKLIKIIQKPGKMRKKVASVKPPTVTCGEHEFSDTEISRFRSSLLEWYFTNGRSLPWRDKGRKEKDDNIRGYSILVSEIMLQQTQVATVIDYYNKWMKRWPDTGSLSKASLEEINQSWAGLGYYSRARRLWESAKMIEDDLNGVVPRSSGDLQKLPGVGRYTAAAVSSIAYGEVTGLVDGNVIRVLSRMRTIGAEIDSPVAVDWIWKLAGDIVDPEKPGDFNQALMELGATVCSPKNPNCTSCPVKQVCQAAKSIPDIEDSCQLCLKDLYDPNLKVTNFPRKSKKAASRDETTLVLALTRDEDGEKTYAVQRRPETGLLANLWELLSVPSQHGFTGEKEKTTIQSFLEERKLLYSGLKRKGEISHIFSHINMTYVVYSATSTGEDSLEYLSSKDFLEKGTSTAMKKVVKFLENKPEQKTRKSEAGTPDPKQRSINSFFKPKTQK